jgi:hypothetical protein
MKRSMYAVLAAFALSMVVGCATQHVCQKTSASGEGYSQAQPAAYPYYTTRGPRDFYTTQPYASIGP